MPPFFTLKIINHARRWASTTGCVLALAVLSACGGSDTDSISCNSSQVALDGRCTDSQSVADSVRTLVRNSMTEEGLRAAIISISVGGVPLLTQAWGESADGQPATTDMHWRNGSIAIAYETTALLQLQDQGLLSTDDKLSKWLPGYPAGDRITLAMLANNTSGYADYVTLLAEPITNDVYRQWTQDELVNTALAQPLKCEPGTCFSYAHTNYIILGRVLSKAGSKPLATLIRDNILTPLGLHDTNSDISPAIPAPVLHAFSADRGTYEDSTTWNPSWTLADGAIMTTSIADALRSAIAIGSGQLVSPNAYAQMLAPLTKALPGLDGKSFYYGLGIAISNSWILQNPSFYGYSGAIAYLPSQQIAIAVTSTMGPSATDTTSATLLTRRITQLLTPNHALPNP